MWAHHFPSVVACYISTSNKSIPSRIFLFSTLQKESFKQKVRYVLSPGFFHHYSEKNLTLEANVVFGCEEAYQFKASLFYSPEFL